MGSHINLDLTELILIYITEITDPEEIINFTYRNYLGQVVCYFLLTYLSIRSIDSLAPSSSSNRLR